MQTQIVLDELQRLSPANIRRERTALLKDPNTWELVYNYVYDSNSVRGIALYERARTKFKIWRFSMDFKNGDTETITSLLDKAVQETTEFEIT